MTKREFELIKDITKLFGVTHVANASLVNRFSPTPTSSALSFSIAGVDYLIYTIGELMDSKKSILNSLPPEYRKDLSPLKNPDKSGYSAKYKGKIVYLLASQAKMERFDSLLTKKYPELSRSTIQKYIKLGKAKLNNITVLTASKQAKSSDEISLDLTKSAKSTEPKFKIIYSDENVIVLDKPAGVLSHSKGAITEEYTVADYFKKHTSYNKTTNRPGIIHRLDRDTSGVMIGALNETTAKYLQRQFSNRTVKKSYYAIVKGQPKLERALLDLPIERNPSKPSTFKVGINGKSAQTEYRIIDSTGQYSLVLLEPKTGRTHQLRVHMAHIGHPIVGDRVYGTPSERLFLHAARLELTLPGGVRKVFESKLPKEFNKLMEI